MRVGLGLGLLALMVPIGIWQSILHDKEKEAQQRLAVANSLERMAATSEKNAKALRDAVGLPPDASSATPQATPGPGVHPSSLTGAAAMMGELSGFMAIISKETAEYQTAYARKVEALHLETVLSAEDLSTPSGRSKGRATMQTFRSYLDGAVAFDATIVAKMNDWIAQHTKDLSASEAAEFRKGFDRGYAKNAARSADFYKVQRDFIVTVAEIADVVDTAAGGVKVTADGRLLFSDNAALARFNELMSTIQSLAAREEALQKEMVASQEATARNLRDLSKSMKR